ncbi:hypothetical protein Taro_016229 [Colocasia esculenta]|uniref:Late embryogenesis abundant protein LEA-2 subgroup domain-containing protein n=1 Tax=Colocasia esculenta TaxID=4460 RepID=A0A843USC3_COLES|nr:hypothetical protein [Colocasia esculenta]
MACSRSTAKWINWIVCLALLAGFIWLFVWLAGRQKQWSIKANVEAASLTRFDLDRNGTFLHYNLTLSVSLRNGNRATVSYDKLAAGAFFDGEEFGSTYIASFPQMEKSTSVFYPTFTGVQARSPGGSFAAELNRQRLAGGYDIDVKLYGNIAIVWEPYDRDSGKATHTEPYSLVADCALKKVPLSSIRSPLPAFLITHAWPFPPISMNRLHALVSPESYATTGQFRRRSIVKSIPIHDLVLNRVCRRRLLGSRAHPAENDATRLILRDPLRSTPMGCLRTTMKWVIALVVLAVLAVIVWLVVLIFKRPTWHIKANVESATLTRFDLDANSTLHYNLTLGVGVRNANRADISYNTTAAAVLYDGRLLGATEVPAFNQGSKTTHMIYPAFLGRAFNMSGGSILARFNKEKGEGVYSIDLKLFSNIRVEWEVDSDTGTTNSRRYSLEVTCALKVAPAAAAGAAFNRTVCDVKY